MVAILKLWWPYTRTLGALGRRGAAAPEGDQSLPAVLAVVLLTPALLADPVALPLVDAGRRAPPAPAGELMI